MEEDMKKDLEHATKQLDGYVHDEMMMSLTDAIEPEIISMEGLEKRR